MNKKELILLISALAAVGLAQDNECQSREIVTLIQRQFDQLSNETLPDTADESIQKLEKSLNILYGRVETIIKPIELKQEMINKTVTQTVKALFRKVETIKQELLTNETVTEIVKKSIVKSNNALFRKVETIKQELLTNETVTEIVKKSMDRLLQTLIPAMPQLLGISPDHPATSCKQILRQNKDSLSDHYWLMAANGTVVEVFCDMTRTCGGITGGWMRVAQLDTTTNPLQCPLPLTRNTQHGKNLCARSETAGGCSEVHYQTNGVAYSEVCGKVIGYQWGSTDGPLAAGVNIDGVSLTHGSPKQHIWSFVAALDETGTNPLYTCDCSNKNNRGTTPLPSFVGDDYFCDTGSIDAVQFILYSNSPLWDGTGCGPNSECCTFQNPPWFYKNLGASTSDSIDMRLCRDEPVTNEDVLLEKVDIYIR